MWSTVSVGWYRFVICANTGLLLKTLSVHLVLFGKRSLQSVALNPSVTHISAYSVCCVFNGEVWRLQPQPWGHTCTQCHTHRCGRVSPLTVRWTPGNPAWQLAVCRTREERDSCTASQMWRGSSADVAAGVLTQKKEDQLLLSDAARQTWRDGGEVGLSRADRRRVMVWDCTCSLMRSFSPAFSYFTCVGVEWRRLRMALHKLMAPFSPPPFLTPPHTHTGPWRSGSATRSSLAALHYVMWSVEMQPGGERFCPLGPSVHVLTHAACCSEDASQWKGKPPHSEEPLLSAHSVDNSTLCSSSE